MQTSDYVRFVKLSIYFLLTYLFIKDFTTLEYAHVHKCDRICEKGSYIRIQFCNFKHV